MTPTLLFTLAALCPQGEGGSRLVLPKPAAHVQGSEAPAEQVPEIQRFKQDVMELRRSKRLSEASQDLVLKKIYGAYSDPSKLALQLARTEPADVLHGLLQVVRRFGSQTDAKTLEYLLLTRPFRSVTRVGVTVMCELAGERQKESLVSCFTSRYSSVRKAAADRLLGVIDQSDLPAMLEFTRSERADVVRKAVFLLGALPYPESQARLVELLSGSDPTTSATACRSLIDHGPEVAPALQEILARPALDHSFGYAAFALAIMEDQTGQVFLSEDHVPRLRDELAGRDAFMHTTAAIAMCNLAFRSTDNQGTQYRDAEVVDGLLLVAAPRGFVLNTSMLVRPATRRLVLFTGRDFRGRSGAWRVWWKDARTGFVGMRLGISVNAESAASARLIWTGMGRVVRIRGEAAPVFPRLEDTETDDYLLTGAEMDALVKRLQAQGFMTQGLLASAASTSMLPVARELVLEFGTARSRISGPAPPAGWLDVLQAELDVVLDRERWQLYRNPRTEVDAVAFWRQEREWLSAHPDRAERQRRLLERILTAYPTLSDLGRARAAAHIVATPDLEAVLTEEDGLTLVRLAGGSEALDDQAFELLEVALLAPGDRVWRSVLDTVAAADDGGKGKALPRVFALLGPDKVLAAIGDGRERVRSAAILEVSKLRDQRAVPELMACLADDSRAIRESAIYALGLLRAPAAVEPLMQLQSSDEIPAATRRVAWVALGRIGGPDVLPILQSGVARPELADRLAAIQAMGELKTRSAADFLAQIFATHGLNPLGTQAMASLEKMGGVIGRRALRRHLSSSNQRVRHEVIMALAEFTDPLVVPDLMAMLELESRQTRVVMLLSSITGLDLASANDRKGVMEEWWRTNKDQPQAVWFLESLQRSRIDTTLRVEQLAPGAGADGVEELTRILLTAPEPYTRVLAAAMLREVTERDFGSVSMITPPEQLRAVADRYRYFADAESAANRKNPR